MEKQKHVLIHDEGKIDIHDRKAKFQQALARLENDNCIYEQNKKLILDFIRDCTLGKTIIGKSKKKIGPARCLKYISILQRLSEELCKSFDDVNQSNMERLIQDLENDRIRTRSGQQYSKATKTDIKKTIKKFWKWKDGSNKTYPELVEWIDTYIAVKDVPALTRSEVEKMIEHTASPRDRTLLMVLFDSGARAEELLNVRLKREHVFWKGDLKCYMIRLEYSKTKPRTISLPLSTSYMTSWLEVHPAKDNPQAQLFPMTYPAMKMVVSRLGRRALGKQVTPHMLRHSSATFYANKLKNPYKLCYRYGWTMASNMVNRYLDREGILEEETATVVKNDELANAGRQNQALREELSLVKESYSELTERFEKLKEDLDGIRSGKGFMKLLLG
ncbi:site-specific integrase, partial [bacterium]|nr:site-specific integrase [bacterium]